MASSGDIRAILSPARFNTLPSDTQSVLVQAWNTQTGQLKAELEKVFTFSQIINCYKSMQSFGWKKLMNFRIRVKVLECKISGYDTGE